MKVFILLLIVCLSSSSLGHPMNKVGGNSEGSSKPKMTRVQLVEDNDEARRMYYELYLKNRDDSLQHSANTGGRVNVDVDFYEDAVKKRAAQQYFDTYPSQQQAQAPEAPIDDVPAVQQETGTDTGSSSPYGALIKSLGLKPTKLTEGVSYTKRSAQEDLVNYPYQEQAQAAQAQHSDAPAPQQEVEADTGSSSPYGALIKSLGLKPTKLTEGVSYTKRSAQDTLYPSFPHNEDVNVVSDKYPNTMPRKYVTTTTTKAPTTTSEETSAKSSDDKSSSPYGALLKLQGIVVGSQPVQRGAGYTKRSAQDSVNHPPQAPIPDAQAPQQEAEADNGSSSPYGALIKSLGLKPTKLTEGVSYTKRSAQEEFVNYPYQEQAQAPQAQHSDAPAPQQEVEADTGSSSPYGALIKSLGLKPTKLTEGVSYTKRSAQDTLYPSFPHNEDVNVVSDKYPNTMPRKYVTTTTTEAPTTITKETTDKSSGDKSPSHYGALLKLQGIVVGSQPVQRGAGYTKRSTVEDEESYSLSEAGHSQAASSSSPDLAMAYMLEAGTEPKAHWPSQA